MVLAARVSSKGQVTVPRKIRQLLAINPGDVVIYEVQDKLVILKRAEPFDVAFHRGLANTLDEWNSQEDDEAFDDL